MLQLANQGNFRNEHTSSLVFTSSNLVVCFCHPHNSLKQALSEIFACVWIIRRATSTRVTSWTSSFLFMSSAVSPQWLIVDLICACVIYICRMLSAIGELFKLKIKVLFWNGAKKSFCDLRFRFSVIYTRITNLKNTQIERIRDCTTRCLRVCYFIHIKLTEAHTN